MSDPVLYSNWLTGLGLAAVVILIAAVLLLLVWYAANRILKLAVAALGLVQQIKANTMVIWSLENTNQTALSILSEAASIRDHGAHIAAALHEADARRPR